MDYYVLRRRMVDEQLLRRGIKNARVLEVFRTIERHRFLPQELAGSSYGDYALPIGEGQTISQPYMVALMTESLQLSGREKVLEIGTGSGYQSAILSQLAASVYTVERIVLLTQRAEDNLKAAGIKNVVFKTADGTLGWPEEAPFDRIIITAATPQVPAPLAEQLKEGGLMVAPVGEIFSQMLMVGRKTKGKIDWENFGGCVFVPLMGKYGFPEN